MKLNKTKYLILILIAIFFASTNELSAKEAGQNYNTESHSFIETGSYVLILSKDLTKTFHAFPFVNHPGTCSGFLNFLSGHSSQNIPPLISNHRYLDNSILRI